MIFCVADVGVIGTFIPIGLLEKVYAAGLHGVFQV